MLALWGSGARFPESRMVEMPADKHVVSAKRSGAEMEHERTEENGRLHTVHRGGKTGESASSGCCV